MRWGCWRARAFVPVLLAGFVAVSQSQPAALADLYRPKNFAEGLARSNALMQLGQDLFFEKALSGSGKMSCASCHDPDHAFTPANDLAVQFGGENLDRPGTRAVPTLKY